MQTNTAVVEPTVENMKKRNQTSAADRIRSYLRHPGSGVLALLTIGAAIVTFAVLLFLVAYILVKGIPYLTPDLFSLEYTSENVSLMPSLINTFIMTALSLVIAAPLGIFAAIYLVEYAKKGNKLVQVIRITAETLSGIPSIVYGLFGMLFFVTALHWGMSLLAGACTLVIMVLPVIMRTAEEALKAALDFEGKPVFITDSGDNVTSGAGGWNTFVLKQVLNVSNLSKSFLFATICDPNTYQLLENKKIGEQVHITLGIGYDELSSPVELDITIKSKGKLVGFMMHDHNEVFGETVNVTINNTKIDIMIASTSWAVCEKQQFIKAGIDWDAYDVIVVKEGYIFPELKAKGKLSIMSLTQGATLQDTAALPFKRIMRPMYPKDNI